MKTKFISDNDNRYLKHMKTSGEYHCKKVNAMNKRKNAVVDQMYE